MMILTDNNRKIFDVEGNQQVGETEEDQEKYGLRTSKKIYR
jgi:hypothetical protein